jgi:hypothetical protein
MAEEEIKEVEEKLHPRFDWLDQFRGVVVLLLIISTITWPLSANLASGEALIGPTFLNHGWRYANYDPAMITIIDIGQQIFMFVMGFVAYIAFSSRLEKKGAKEAWKHGLIRVAILYIIAFLDDGLIGGDLLEGGIGWISNVLYNGTLANLAIGSLAAMVGVYFIKDADKRILLGIGIMVFHAIFYEIPVFDTYFSTGGGIDFPFNALNHAAIAIIATCFSQWLKMDPDDITFGFKKRILPASSLAFIGCYCVDFLQQAEHHDVTTSLALMAIGTAGFMVAIFYGFEKLNFKVPALSEMGRNLLLLFILSFLFGDQLALLMLNTLGRDFLAANPLISLGLLGILPIAIEAGIAVLLAKKNIIIKI